MSETEQMTAEEIRSELKRALIMGDFHKAERILMHSGDAVTRMEQIRIMEIIERAKYGTTTPMQNPDIYALAVKL